MLNDKPHWKNQVLAMPKGKIFQTDRATDTQIDRWARWQVSKISTYARLIESDALIILMTLTMSLLRQPEGSVTHSILPDISGFCRYGSNIM